MSAVSFCQFCQQACPPSEHGRKYCSIKCQKRAERQRAKERESMFFGSAPEQDPRYLWTEPSPTWDRICKAAMAVKVFNDCRPKGEREKTVEFYGICPVDTGDGVLPVMYGYGLYRLRSQMPATNKWIMLSKWILVQMASEAQTPMEAVAMAIKNNNAVVPPHIARDVHMAEVLALDEEADRMLDREIEALAPEATLTLQQPMDELQLTLQKKKRQDLSDLPTYDAPTEAPKFISTEGLPPGVSEEEYARQQDQQSLKDKLGLK